MKIAGSGTASESGSGSISQRHGSADPDLHQNVIDPQHCFSAVYRIRIHRIHMFLGLPDPDPLVRCMDPDPDPSIIMQK
jgi:hypothetical protein